MAKANWKVRVEDTDGTHTIGRYTTYAAALAKAKEWLGRAEWQSGTNAIGEYGSALTLDYTGDWATMPTKDAEAMQAHHAEVTAWMREEREAAAPTTEPCGECGRPTTAGGEGICYECQCKLHAIGAIDMDNDPWRGPVEPSPRYDFGDYDPSEDRYEAPAPTPAPAPQATTNDDSDIPF